MSASDESTRVPGRSSTTRMLLRASVVWVAILVLAIGNGALRETLISPHVGPQSGHVLSTLLLCLVIMLVAWLAIRWMAPGTKSRAFVVGSWWLVLTITFEFVAGHYLFGDSWDDLLAAYDIFRGNVWVLVPIATVFAPPLAQWLRQT